MEHLEAAPDLPTLPPEALHHYSGAFRGCTGLTHLTFPEGLTTIYFGAFRGCTGLTHLAFLEGLTTIYGGAFRGCTGLKHLTLPEGLTTIGNGAFSYCSGLQYIFIPQSLENHDVAYWQDKGIDAARTKIITRTQLQAFVASKKIDSQTNIHEITALFLADQGYVQLPQARDHLSIHPIITKLSLSNLFSLPILKHLILPGFVNTKT